ncbi:MAG: hypothetical protein RL240_4564 [Planctomycetota bacterium]
MKWKYTWNWKVKVVRVFQPGASARAADMRACGREGNISRKALASGLTLNRMVKVVQVFKPGASARAAETPACGREGNISRKALASGLMLNRKVKVVGCFNRGLAPARLTCGPVAVKKYQPEGTCLRFNVESDGYGGTGISTGG